MYKSQQEDEGGNPSSARPIYSTCPLAHFLAQNVTMFRKTALALFAFAAVALAAPTRGGLTVSVKGA